MAWPHSSTTVREKCPLGRAATRESPPHPVSVPNTTAASDRTWVIVMIINSITFLINTTLIFIAFLIILINLIDFYSINIASPIAIIILIMKSPLVVSLVSWLCMAGCT